MWWTDGHTSCYDIVRGTPRYVYASRSKKSEGTRKVEYAYNFWKRADAVDRKFSQSVHAWRNYSLPKLARSWRHSVVMQMLCIAVEMDQWASVGSVSWHAVPTTSKFIQAVQEDCWRPSLWNVFQWRLVHRAIAMTVPAGCSFDRLGVH